MKISMTCRCGLSFFIDTYTINDDTETAEAVGVSKALGWWYSHTCANPSPPPSDVPAIAYALIACNQCLVGRLRHVGTVRHNGGPEIFMHRCDHCHVRVDIGGVGNRITYRI